MKEKKEVAAAIQYNEDKDYAPRVVAKGKGEVAQKIKELAKDNDIPTYQDEKLARQLYNLSIGDEIPPELYHVVAEILAFIITLDTKEQ
ncbi:flagellar biosynthesis protein [Geosporobacter subterraneus DSM 17957]|uniref:Flagellar biosynthesis protein n=1 Tax=Geosporobacter subterraneus DSM 17957 TaxID=1121919 RepID=A0A1M6E624_9FIRM|nr:EscU/YscU/HrcU family type III secretion system export apparatus switch protein [Geosporobacter subterraneus]SHI80843.1 flagellar biosynthesis protein [Geosporobacter subterraneus DSM 17957]